MDFVLLGIVGALCLLGMLSVFESSINHLSKLALRVLVEKQDTAKHELLSEIASDRRHFLIPLQFSIQLISAVLAVVLTWYISLKVETSPLIWALIAAILVVVLFRQLIPYLVTLKSPERVLVGLLPIFTKAYRILYWVSFPIVFVLHGAQRNHKERSASDEDEATEEEIQAYLGVGEEEGIFDGEETELIQSALEFGNTLVREIMTPRSEIIAIEDTATIKELRELIVSSKHSRVPVYREQIDQVVGIVYVRNLLARYEAGREDEPITPIISEVLIVPESKPVDDLMKEMQAKAEQMAIIVNEYGTVSGLVTIEDLIEEIVGEIRDEDESRSLDLVYEGEGKYIVRGGVEIPDLEEALNFVYGEHDASTVSGLVVERLGHVPSPGDSLVLDGTMIEILSADSRKIHKLRVRLASDNEIVRSE